MSVTLVLVPVSLSSNIIMGLVTSLVASAALTAQKTGEINRDIKYMRNNFDMSNMIVEKAMNREYEQYQTFCSQYKTIFKDEELLIKTLREHGVQNIEKADDKIYGTLEGLKFEFEKDETGIYVMHITHKENDDLSIVNELGDEYQLNVQEQSYNNLKTKSSK